MIVVQFCCKMQLLKYNISYKLKYTEARLLIIQNINTFSHNNLD